MLEIKGQKISICKHSVERETGADVDQLTSARSEQKKGTGNTTKVSEASNRHGLRDLSTSLVIQVGYGNNAIPSDFVPSLVYASIAKRRNPTFNLAPAKK